MCFILAQASLRGTDNQMTFVGHIVPLGRKLNDATRATNKLYAL